MKELESLLDSVAKETHAFKTARRLYSKQLAPDFTIFDYISTNEVGLSLIIADLLNPKGRHGQGEVFLRLFIDSFLGWMNEDEHTLGTLLLKNIKNTQLSVEETTWKSQSRRRMDIYLYNQIDTSSSYGICIENKPYAYDQDNQLTDYATELKKRHGDNWHIIYLNHSGTSPSECSVTATDLKDWTENKHFTALKYSDLIDWLSSCKNGSQSHRVTDFIEQFIQYIEREFMGFEDMSESDAILSLMQSNTDRITASFNIAKNLIMLKKDFIKKLKQELIAKNAVIENYHIDVSNIGLGKQWDRIDFILNNNTVFCICLEFNTNFTEPYYGVRYINVDDSTSHENKELADAIFIKLNESLANIKLYRSGGWPAYYYDTAYDWAYAEEPWLQILDGRMTDLILSQVDGIYNSIEELL